MTQNIFFFQAKYFVSKLSENRKIIRNHSFSKFGFAQMVYRAYNFGSYERPCFLTKSWESKRQRYN